MKSLILVTPRELRRHFNKIMSECTDMCVNTCQDIIIIIPTSKNANTYEEIARVIYNDNGYTYVYDEALLKKYNIGPDKLQTKIEVILANAFEESGIAEMAREHEKLRPMLETAMAQASKEIIKLIKSCDTVK